MDEGRSEQIVLARFSSYEHVKSFRRGLMYMNNISFFVQEKGNAARHDRFEGIDRLVQPDQVKSLRISPGNGAEDLVFTSNDLGGPISIALSKPFLNVFCLHILDTAHESPTVDKNNFAFGDSYTIITNTQKFVDRVVMAAHKQNFVCTYGPVSYFDHFTFNGDTGPFLKSSLFAYQREFRFCVEPGVDGPFRLQIGSIEDITTPIYCLSKINESVRFNREV